MREAIDAQWFDVDSVPVPVLVVPIDYPTGWHIERHVHRKAQLIYCISGVMSVETAQRHWVAPPNCSVWMPGGIEHEIHITQAARMRTLFVEPTACKNLPTWPCSLGVSSLLRELILASVIANKAPDPKDYALGTPNAHIAAVLLDQIRAMPPSELHIPMPADRRLKPICAALTADPGDRRSLKQWADDVNASDRTIERLFMQETGLTFHRWREQMRVLKSLTLLQNGRAVKNVALDLGFANPSTFIAMFRKIMGKTPGAYLKDGASLKDAD
ncbi:AraC family transcriptional regulator [Dongia rigui]|uniref:Helix-turn-helix transcriptional regulator n=1 Tax=Dongia rigui TaxID=940149 RepID=A0ABU5DXI0_9PROT|nr:helix-turn-helix transcriptional regulator [Dongia rigui]MDY0872027.1 helix-turn-helix transcriptional regulator [Dongia rigui]